MGTRYAQEKIGEITDDEVIFERYGARFFLKEISRAVHMPDKDVKSIRNCSIFEVCLGIILTLMMTSDEPYIYKFFSLVMIAMGCVGFVWSSVRPHNIIVLKAKNGETMYTYRIDTNGEHFVRQLNRYIG